MVTLGLAPVRFVFALEHPAVTFLRRPDREELVDLHLVGAPDLPDLVHGEAEAAIRRESAQLTALQLHEVDLERRTCTCRRSERPCIHVRKAIDICENGSKALAEEATLRRVTPAFLSQWM